MKIYIIEDDISVISVLEDIIEENARPIGFVMATDKTYAPQGFDFALEEIFLIRNRRNQGIADIAMGEITKDRPGRWTLEVYTKNLPALSFWKRYLFENAQDVSSETAADSPFTRFTFTIRR